MCSLGKGEVVCSIHTGGTTYPLELKGFSARAPTAPLPFSPGTPREHPPLGRAKGGQNVHGPFGHNQPDFLRQAKETFK